MKTLVFFYNDRAIHIIRGEHEGKTVYHIYVSGNHLSFVSNPDTAKRIAVNFIDVVEDPLFASSRQQWQGGSKLKTIDEWRKKRNY